MTKRSTAFGHHRKGGDAMSDTVPGKLTKRVVDAARPSSSRYVVWDGKLAGFGVRIETTGRKTFIVRYRAGGGRTGALRQANIGRYGTVTVEKARKAAGRILGAAGGARR
jgi:hypothetical protein